MQGSFYVVAVLSTLFAAGAARPRTEMLPRAAVVAPQPKYSVVPLEPGDDDQRGSTPDAPKAVVETIVKTEEPVTQIVTKTGEPITVTQLAPTSVPVVPIGGNTIVTITVTAEPTSTGRATDSTTTAPATPTMTSPTVVTTPSTTAVAPPASSVSTSWRDDDSECISRVVTEGTWTPVSLTTTTVSEVSRQSTSVAFTTTTAPAFVPTTLCTVLITSPVFSTSTRTYDDGLWHTTYPPWNETAPHGWRRR